MKGQSPNSITQTTNQKLMLTQNTIVTVDTISLHTLCFLVAHKITTVVSTHTHTHTHTHTRADIHKHMHAHTHTLTHSLTWHTPLPPTSILVSAYTPTTSILVNIKQRTESDVCLPCHGVQIRHSKEKRHKIFSPVSSGNCLFTERLY